MKVTHPAGEPAIKSVLAQDSERRRDHRRREGQGDSVRAFAVDFLKRHGYTEQQYGKNGKRLEFLVYEKPLSTGALVQYRFGSVSSIRRRIDQGPWLDVFQKFAKEKQAQGNGHET